MMTSLGDVSRCEITRPKAMVIQKILTYVTQFLSQEAVWVPAPPSATLVFILIV